MKADTYQLIGSKTFQALVHRCLISVGHRNPLSRLNDAMDAYPIPWDLNESVIENLMHHWERQDRADLPQYWLLGARLFEMAIMCAGHYVDHCEFAAAGDLLFNPRKVQVFEKRCPHPRIKNRHGRLSRQFNGHRDTDQSAPSWCRQNVIAQVVAPALLPYLLHGMEQSGNLTAAYLQSANARMQKAAEAIGFLGAWSISCYEDLHERLETASTGTRRFIAEHLCTFDRQCFDILGNEVRRLCGDPLYRSDFVAGPGSFHDTAHSANDSIDSRRKL